MLLQVSPVLPSRDFGIVTSFLLTFWLLERKDVLYRLLLQQQANRDPKAVDSHSFCLLDHHVATRTLDHFCLLIDYEQHHAKP
jgi:hypothetical protein